MPFSSSSSLWRKSLLLLWIFILFIFFVPQTAQATNTFYELSYDGGLGANLAATTKGNEHIPERITKRLCTSIGEDLILSWKKQKQQQQQQQQQKQISNVKQLLQQANPECRGKLTFGNFGQSQLCESEIMDEELGLFLEVSLKLYYKSEEDGRVGALLKVTMMDTGDDSVKEILLDMLQHIDRILHIVRSPWDKPIWDIQVRPSSLDLFQQSQHDESKLHENSYYKNSRDPSSLEFLVLSNPLLAEKQRIAKNGNFEIWSYYKYGSSERTTSLFMDAKLRYTTDFAGLAHAEAFIHPVLISHWEPETIAIFSETPLALIHEVLKHKDVETIHLYNADPNNLELFVEAFPDLNDCSYMRGNGSSPICMENIEIQTTFEPGENLYSLIFIDVPPTPSGKEFFLSKPFIDDIMDSLEDEQSSSAVVINVGHPPGDKNSVVNGSSDEIEEDDYRSNFIRMATRTEENGGMGVESLHVYDEPNAAPLDSTFILITGHDSVSHTYHQFFRKNPAGIDLDIAEHMYPPPESSNAYIHTSLYDGPTHLNYIYTSRNWERWYCRTKPWNQMPVCTEFLPKIYDTQYHASVDKVEYRVDSTKGRTLYSTEDIPKGRFILPRDTANIIALDTDHYSNFFDFITDVPSASLYKSMYYTIDGYGFEASGYGFNGYMVSTTIGSFMNHACNDNELNANPLHSLEEDEDGEDARYFSPVFTRRSEMYLSHTMSTRDIQKGEEILFDYKSTYIDGVMDDAEANMCAGGSGHMSSDNAAVMYEGDEGDKGDDGDKE